MNPVDKLKEMSIKFDIREISSWVLGDQRFSTCSGSASPGTHHYGIGGLANHTLEVAELCLLNNQYFKGTDKFTDERVLFLAAIFHDAGKIFDYNAIVGDEEKDKNLSNWHKTHIHHITKSAIIWDRACNNIIPKFMIKHKWLTHKLKAEIMHAILAHHQLREYGSPVTPKTKLAWMLHLCDSISARITDSP